MIPLIWNINIYQALVSLFQKITLNNSGKQSFHWFLVSTYYSENEIYLGKVIVLIINFDYHSQLIENN